MDNGTMESLLSDMKYFQHVQKKDAQIGFSGTMDYLEKLLETTQELHETFKNNKGE